ncbi:MAG: winged helix-turn-helix transcriptional regulator [Candidatus Sungbacteria bacterium]|nr:winged helix-turn-helix transcriptional regulator [Candidatus Sungbacteria bacterium]
METKNSHINELSRAFGLFQDPLRLRLFVLLVNMGKGGRRLCVSELAEKLGGSLSNTSHQLHKLELAGIVERVRRGRMVCYQFRRTPFNMKMYSFIRSTLEI